MRSSGRTRVSRPDHLSSASGVVRYGYDDVRRDGARGAGKRREMLRAAIVATLVASPFGSNVEADVPSRLGVGSRIRVTATESAAFRITAPNAKPATKKWWQSATPSQPRPLVARVLSVDRDSLDVRPEGRKDTTRVMLALVERIELSQGPRHERAKGAVYGAGLGAGAALVVVGLAEYNNLQRPPEEQAPERTEGDFIRWGMWGALIGGVAGSLFHKEEAWSEVTFAWREGPRGIRGGFAAAPLPSPGMVTFVRLSF